MLKQGDSKIVDFKSSYGEHYKKPQEQPSPQFLLNLKASGYCKNNLTNDGKTYYFERKENLEDRVMTEYKRSFSGQRRFPWSRT